MRTLQRAALCLQQLHNEGDDFSFVTVREEVDKCLWKWKANGGGGRARALQNLEREELKRWKIRIKRMWNMIRCRRRIGVCAEGGGYSVCPGKSSFAVTTHQMLCGIQFMGAVSHQGWQRVLALEGCDADETLFELFEVSLVSFFFSLLFFFPCGFLLSSTEQTRTFPCRSSLRRTRTLLNYLTYSPYSKESSRSFPRSPGSITLGHRQSKPLSWGQQWLQLTVREFLNGSGSFALLCFAKPYLLLSSSDIDRKSEILVNCSLFIWTCVMESFIVSISVVLSIIMVCATSSWIWGLCCQELCPVWKRFQSKAGQKPLACFPCKCLKFTVSSAKIWNPLLLKKNNPIFNSADGNK